MEQYKKLINVQKVNNSEINISYLDYNIIIPSNNQLQSNSFFSNQLNYPTEFSIQYYTRHEKLTQNDISNVEKSIINKIVELSEKNSKSNTYEHSRLDILETNIEPRKILSKILMASNRIAVESRIGPATNILMSKEIYYHFKLYTLEQITQVTNFGDVTTKLCDLDITFDERLSNIYVFRINRSDQVGLSLLYNDDNRYCICEKGNYPEKSFVKLKLSKKFERMKKLKSL